MENGPAEDLLATLRELDRVVQRSLADLPAGGDRPAGSVGDAVDPGARAELRALLGRIRAGARDVSAVVGRLERALGGRADTWAHLRGRTSPPQPPPVRPPSTPPSGPSSDTPAASDDGASPGGAPDLWWLPSLVLLAAAGRADEQARDELERWSVIRDRLAYVVVDEIVDDAAEVAVQPWPLVDERGRVRFPTIGDSGHLSLPVEVLQQLLDAHRERWRQLGLLAGELVARPVDLGDVVAADIRTAPARTTAETAAPADAGMDPTSLHGRLAPFGDARFEISGDEPVARATLEDGRWIEIGGYHDGELLLPILDITWDGRESAKLAYGAAFGGEITATFQQSLDQATEAAQQQYRRKLEE